MNRDKIYFCWVMFAGQPHAQKWYGTKVNSNTGKEYPPEILAYSRLLEEQEYNMTLSELALKYPFEKKKEIE